MSRSVVLCQYNRAQCDPETIDLVLRTHSLAVLGQMVCPNPFYVPPRIRPQSELPRRVDWMIAQLRDDQSMEQTNQRNLGVLCAVAEGMTDALFVKDRNGRYLMINSAGAKFLGKSVGDVIGKDDTELFAPGDRHPFLDDDPRIMSTGAAETHEDVGTAAGVTRNFLSTKAPYRDEHGNIIGIIGIARDITERKRAENQLEESRRCFEEIYENALDPILLLNDFGHFADFNPAGCELLGWSREMLSQMTLWDVTPGENQAAIPGLLGRFLSAGSQVGEYTLLCKDGTTRQVEYRAVANIRPGLHVAVCREITERKIAEQKLREYAISLQNLSQRVIDVQEEERRHLARELHDEIGQVLSTVYVNLQAVMQQCHPDAQSRVESSIRIVGDAIQQIRDISMNLRPAMLDDLGLISTLRWFADRQAQAAGFRLNFTATSSGERLPSQVETACYRVVQEALTNVLRHAVATQVWLDCQQDETGLRISVRDDGAGFDISSIRSTWQASLGLLGMQERVEVVGGEFEISSQPGLGTTIHVRFPASTC